MALACCGLTVGAPGALAATGTPPSGDIALYPMTVFRSTEAEDLTTGPDGNIWYTMQSDQSPAIGVMSTDGTVLATYHTARNCDPGDITSGPDDALWFDCSSYDGNVGSWIGEITTAGVQTLYPMPVADGGSILGITVGVDGNVWFTDDAYNADNGDGYIGVMTPEGAVTQWALPFEFLPNELHDDIALGPDGNVWLAGDDGDGTTVLAFATPTGAISDVMEPSGDGDNEGIAAGPGGDLYFTDRDSVYGSARLGWINAADQVNYTDLPPGFVPGQPGVGPDGNVYIAGSSGGLDGLLYFSPADFSTAFYELPNPYDYYAQDLAAGPDGNEYFTNPATQSVGRFAVAEPDATALTIAAPSGPLYAGQSGAVVATLTPGYSTDPTPTGSVAFFDDGVALATVPVAPDGTADLPLSDLSGGGNTIYATYSGDGNFGPLSTQFLGVGITADPTTTTLTSSQDPSSTGQSVTVTASVASDPPGGGVPAGAVQFAVDGVNEGGFSLDGNGDATFDLTGLAAGAHTVAAQYIPAQSAVGGYDFAGSTASLTQTVTQSASDAVTLASSVNPTVYGQGSTITATVAPGAAGSTTPTGTMTFSVDGTAQASVGLSAAGSAAFPLPLLGAGTHSVTAAYSGDATYPANSAAPLSQTVQAASTAVTLTSSADPTDVGQSVTFTAAVAAQAPGTGTPNGSVVFTVDGVAQSPVALDGSGTAAFADTALTAGANTVSAAYGGAGDFAVSSSAALTQTVDQPTATTLSVSPSGGATQGSTVTLTARATPPVGGTVQFYDGASALGGAVTVSAGQASYSTSALALGAHELSAVFTPTAAADLGSSSGQTAYQISSPPTGPGIDQTITATGTGTVTTAAFSTGGPRLLVAFTGADGSSAKQTTTVSGAGLTWTLTARENAKGGTAEIWTAMASSPLSGVTVTSTLKTGGYDQQLTVVAFTGAAGTGATAIAAKAKGEPSVALTTTAAGSWVFGVGEDYSTAAARALGAGQTLVGQWVDTGPGETFWVQRENAPTAASGGLVTIDDTAPTADIWDLAAVEVLAEP